MATNISRIKPLKGLSRSTYCAVKVGSKSQCHRLSGHHGPHKARAPKGLTMAAKSVVKAPKVVAQPKAEKPAAKPTSTRRVVRKVARNGQAGKALRAKLAADVEAGKLSASDAMSRFAARIK